MNFRPSRWGAVLSLSLMLGLCMPGPSAWAARGKRSVSASKKAKTAKKVRKGPQPKLLSPAADAELESGRVTFMWKVVAKRVRLEVARDEEFTDTVIDELVKGRKAVLPLEPGSYYWRVTVPKKTPSDPRRLTVAGEQPEALPEPRTQAEPQPEPIAAGGLGLDLTGATTPSATSEAAPSDTAPQGLDLPGSTQASTAVTSGANEPKEPTESAAAEAERASSSSQGGSRKKWSLFIGGSAAYGTSAPNSMTALRYEASVAYRLANPFELSLAVGGSATQALGIRDASWPYYIWTGQAYVDLGARYRLVRLGGSAALYGLAAGRLSFFTGREDQRGFLADNGPFSAGVGLAGRFRVGLPVELGLRGNLLTGNKLGGELELALRVLVF